MTKFDNDQINYQSQTNSEQLAVFSEIYYKDWKAYVDGKETPILKVNYVLRALVIPAGKHEIVFKFEPAVYYTSRTISSISNWLIILLLLASAGYLVYNNKNIIVTTPQITSRLYTIFVVIFFSILTFSTLS